MPKSHAGNELYGFGDFRLDDVDRSLWRGGRRIPVPDRAFETLCVLVRNRHRLVSKDEFMSEVWKDAVVEENNLAKSISALRKVLGEQADGGSFIETVRGRGFRFVADVTVLTGHAGGGDAGEETDPEGGQVGAARADSTEARRWSPLWLAPAAIAVLAGVGVLGGPITSVAVLPFGDAFRIRFELTDARDNTHVWGAEFGRSPTDPLLLQSQDLQAYESLLRGDVHLKGRDVESGRKAVAAYQQAIAIDPDSALAHARLSEGYRNLADLGTGSHRELMSLARSAAQRASELAPGLAEAQLELANFHLDAWNWAEADARFQHAIELNPHLSRARRNYTAYLGIVGRSHDAIVEATRTRHLDPQTLSSYGVVAHAFYAARRYDDGIAEYERVVAIDDTQAWAYAFLGHSYRAKGMFRKAIATYQAAIRLGDRSPSLLICLGTAHAQAGDHRRARAILEELRASGRYVAPGEVAAMYVALGERERAFALLDEAYAVHDPQLQYLIIEPGFDPLRDDPRYDALLRRVGLPNRTTPTAGT